MTHREAPEIVLLVIGLLGLVKAVFGLASPDLVKRAAEWWLRIAARVNTLIAGVCVLLGLLLWVAVLAGQPLVNWVLLLIGIGFVGGAAVYAKPGRLETMVRAFVLDRKPYMIRVLGAVGGVVSILLIWIALKG